MTGTEKRYQVFISSTYADLIKERQEVIQALLELDCIPSGMELFQAANEDQWSTIKRVIDDCDYYIVIIGGRYGSIGPDKISYTEMEYRYALEAQKPIIAFLHKDPGKITSEKSEQDPDSIQKLSEFRDLAQQKMVKFWMTAEDLGSIVSRSMVRLMKTNPATGWIRADEAMDTESLKQINHLRKQIDELESEIKRLKTTAPSGSEQFAQGNGTIKINILCNLKGRGYVTFTEDTSIDMRWNELFAILAPHMIDEASDSSLQNKLCASIKSMYGSDRLPTIQTELEYSSGRMIDCQLYRVDINDDDFQTIKVQFRALGLIEKSSRNRSVKDKETYWTLTPFGDQEMTKLRAIKRT